jgi:hypothetical protein
MRPDILLLYQGKQWGAGLTNGCFARKKEPVQGIIAQPAAQADGGTRTRFSWLVQWSPLVTLVVTNLL